MRSSEQFRIYLYLTLQDGTCAAGSMQTVASLVSGSSAASSASANTGVNKAIQALAHRYCVECKGTFDELSKITQVWNNLGCLMGANSRRSIHDDTTVDYVLNIRRVLSYFDP